MKFDDAEADEVIDDLADAERKAYQALLEAEEAHKKAKQALVAEIEVRGLTWVPWRGQKITVIRQERVKVDAQALRENLPADVWSDVVEEKVSTERLRAAIVAGRVPKEAVDKAVQITTTSPYARYGELGDQ